MSDVWRAVASRRYALLAGTAFSQGASLGPLIGAAMAMDSALVIHSRTFPLSLRPTDRAAPLSTRRHHTTLQWQCGPHLVITNRITRLRCRC